MVCICSNDLVKLSNPETSSLDPYIVLGREKEERAKG